MKKHGLVGVWTCHQLRAKGSKGLAAGCRRLHWIVLGVVGRVVVVGSG